MVINQESIELVEELINVYIPFYQKILMVMFLLIFFYKILKIILGYYFYQRKLGIVSKMDVSFLKQNTVKSEDFLYMKKVYFPKKVSKNKNREVPNDSQNQSFYYECEICTERQDLLI